MLFESTLADVRDEWRTRITDAWESKISETNFYAINETFDYERGDDTYRRGLS